MTAEEFIKGFRELRLKSPHIAVSGYKNTNCDYSNATYNSRNCYMCFDVDSAENCLNCGLITRCKTCVDCEDTWDSELCYEGIELYNCYNCDFSEFLRDCSDCNFSFDLLNCHNCFGCVGLRRSEYYIFNEKYSKKDYEEKVSELKKMPLETIKKKVQELRLKYPHLASRQYQTDKCLGDNIQNSRNVFYGFNVKGMFDGGYLYDVYNVYHDRSENSYDNFFSVDLHHCYETIQAGECYDSNFLHYCEHIRDSEFCEGCFNSNHLFGCVSVNRREYLILNESHDKEEWHKKTAEIRDALKATNSYSWESFGSSSKWSGI